MKAVWKYQLKELDWQLVEMPENAQLLTVQLQNGKVCLWALVDPTLPMTSRSIYIAGTGRDIPDSLASGYIGTVQVLDGKLVYHVFDCGEECSLFGKDLPADGHR